MAPCNGPSSLDPMLLVQGVLELASLAQEASRCKRPQQVLYSKAQRTCAFVRRWTTEARRFGVQLRPESVSTIPRNTHQLRKEGALPSAGRRCQENKSTLGFIEARFHVGCKPVAAEKARVAEVGVGGFREEKVVWFHGTLTIAHKRADPLTVRAPGAQLLVITATTEKRPE